MSDKAIEFAENNNLTFIGKSTKDKNHFEYRFNECGHKQPIHKAQLYKTLTHKPECLKCKEIEDKKFFRSLGIKRIEILPERRALYQCLSCGFIMNIRRDKLNAGIFACQSCEDQKRIDEAEDQGLEYLRKGKIRFLYRIKECNHLKMIKPSDVRIGKWTCQLCKDTYHSKPSKLYLIKITNKKTLREWLKVGIAKNLQQRFKGYGLDDHSEISVLDTIDFNTHKEAYRIEQDIHQKYKDEKLDKDLMMFYMSSGNTECYPCNMLSKLTKEIQKIAA